MLSELAIRAVAQQGLFLFLGGLPLHLSTMKLSSGGFAAKVCECPCLLSISSSEGLSWGSAGQRWGQILAKAWPSGKVPEGQVEIT